MTMAVANQQQLWEVVVSGPQWFQIHAELDKSGKPTGRILCVDNTRWASSMSDAIWECVFFSESKQQAELVYNLLQRTEPITGRFVKVKLQKLQGKPQGQPDRFYKEGNCNGDNPTQSVDVPSLSKFLGLSVD